MAGTSQVHGRGRQGLSQLSPCSSRTAQLQGHSAAPCWSCPWTPAAQHLWGGGKAAEPGPALQACCFPRLQVESGVYWISNVIAVSLDVCYAQHFLVKRGTNEAKRSSGLSLGSWGHQWCIANKGSSSTGSFVWVFASLPPKFCLILTDFYIDLLLINPASNTDVNGVSLDLYLCH